jgi:hypothetical protein
LGFRARTVFQYSCCLFWLFGIVVMDWAMSGGLAGGVPGALEVQRYPDRLLSLVSHLPAKPARLASYYSYACSAHFWISEPWPSCPSCSSFFLTRC